MVEQARLFTARVVHALDGGAPATAFVTRGERVVATGAFADLRRRHRDAEVVDFGDAVITPGFNDAHVHPSIVAEDLLHVDLSPDVVRSRAELIDALRSQAAATPAGQWVRATRYDHMRTTGGHIVTRDELDAISTRHPILVANIGGHWGITNSPGLAAGGLDETSTAPAGGELGRYDDGRLNGVLYERSLFAYSYSGGADEPTIIPEASPADLRRGLSLFLQKLGAAGITSACDALVGPSGVTLFRDALDAGELTARISMLVGQPHSDAVFAEADSFDRPDWLKLTGVKAFVDGAIAGRTCLVHEPFEGTDEHGIQATEDDELLRLVLHENAAGRRVGVHANGDHAIEKLLDAYEHADRLRPGSVAGYRIEHCSMVTPDIVRRIKRLGLIVVPFGSYVAYHGEKLRDWYGDERLHRMFAHRWFLDARVPVAGSSDYPCGQVEPLLGMQSCVTRQSPDGMLLGESQRITAQEALELYTVGSAQATGDEGRRGRLTSGYLADFVVLDDDPLTVPPETLAKLPVLSTWVGARQCWSASS
jgi:predicted amidohydrolase YtcJ